MMNDFIERLVGMLIAIASQATSIVSLSFSRAESTDRERTEHEGTELFGEYNFRTDKLDAGADPYGWYEEDM